VTALDRSLFHWLNSIAVAPALDPLMVFVTNSRVWQVVLVVLAIGLAGRRDRTSRLAALALGLSLALSDVLAAQVLKPVVGRLRPCHALEGVRLLVDGCGGRNGFPSNHAANAGAAAAALGVFLPGSLRVTVPLALLVAWSRVYVGVHYPGDVAAGLVFGAAVGVLLAVGLRRRFGLSTGRSGTGLSAGGEDPTSEAAAAAPSRTGDA
jgi:undecaprenyl-diphosphatase